MTRLQRIISYERSLMLFGLSRLVLWLAVASNVGRAIVAFRGTRTEDIGGQSWLTAIALEGALALSAYALAERRASGQRAGALWAVTGLFCIISASANIAYFAAGVPAGPALIAPVLWGLAAPAVALANAWLAGSMTGSEVAKQDLAAQDAHTERLAELEAQAEVARASAARAEARRARAESMTARPVTVQPSVPDVQPSHNARARVQYADFARAIESGSIDLARATSTDVVLWAAQQGTEIDGSTGRRWAARARDNGFERVN